MRVLAKVWLKYKWRRARVPLLQFWQFFLFAALVTGVVIGCAAFWGRLFGVPALGG